MLKKVVKNKERMDTQMDMKNKRSNKDMNYTREET
jgi:hypothetical protein